MSYQTLENKEAFLRFFSGFLTILGLVWLWFDLTQGLFILILAELVDINRKLPPQEHK